MVTERKRGMKMQDRYLFKAKRKDNGEWVEGFYFCMTHTDGRHTHHFIIPLGADLSLGTPVEKIQVEVDQSTICQCTGLKDKNGKLIWENDVCDRKEEYPEIVKYNKGDWTLDYSYSKDRESGYCYCNLGFYVLERKCVEVIGNVFDNPELLEV
jgi:uncharacterized phage protein (TIGR01671 family)|nr:MAG TPA: YopX protein [Caudoviricetes sp.]